MKRYKIFAFENKGWFVAEREFTEDGILMMMGKFEGNKTVYIFIKNEKDIPE